MNLPVHHPSLRLMGRGMFSSLSSAFGPHLCYVDGRRLGLSFKKVDFLQAVKIALEVKKYLVDNDFMDISQVWN